MASLDLHGYDFLCSAQVQSLRSLIRSFSRSLEIWRVLCKDVEQYYSQCDNGHCFLTEFSGVQVSEVTALADGEAIGRSECVKVVRAILVAAETSSAISRKLVPIVAAADELLGVGKHGLCEVATSMSIWNIAIDKTVFTAQAFARAFTLSTSGKSEAWVSPSVDSTLISDSVKYIPPGERRDLALAFARDAQLHMPAAIFELLKFLRTDDAAGVLQHTNYDGGLPAAVGFARHDAALFREALQLLPQIRSAVLAAADRSGWNAYHYLADHHGAVLEQILLDLGDEGAARVLAAANQQSRKPVAHSLAERHPRGLARVAAQSGATRAALLRAADAGGRLAYHVLAELHGGVLLDLLLQLDEQDAVAALRAQGPRAALPVAISLAFADPQLFKAALLQRPALLAAACEATDQHGWTALHYLSDHHGEVMEQLLCEAGEASAARVLAASNPLRGRPVAHSLACRHPWILCSLAAQRRGVLPALLRVTDGAGRLAYHALAEAHSASLLGLLRRLERGAAVAVLAARNSRTGQTVADALGCQCPAMRGQLASDFPEAFIAARLGCEGGAPGEVRDAAAPGGSCAADAKGRAVLHLRTLLRAMRFPAFSRDEIRAADLERLFAALSVHGPSYLAALASYQEAQRVQILCLLATIVRIIDEAAAVDNSIKQELQHAMNDVRCFPHHYQNLLDICFFSGLNTSKIDPVLAIVGRELWLHATVEIRAALSMLISKRVFGNCPDNMSTHTDSCVAHALDQLYGLFGAKTIDDLFCPSSNLVCMLVHHLVWPMLTREQLEPVLTRAVCGLTGEHKWALVRLLVGDIGALEVAAAVEHSDYSSELFTMDQFQKLTLLLNGFDLLIEKLDLFQDPENDSNTRPSLCLTLEENHIVTILSKIVVHESKISFSDWKLCCQYYSMWKTLESRNSQNLLRMGYSLLEIVVCHLNLQELALALENAEFKLNIASALGHCSFVQPELFLSIINSNNFLLLSPYKQFGSVLHFLAHHNHKMLEALMIKDGLSVYLYSCKALNAAGELWQHALARTNAVLLLKFLKAATIEQIVETLSLQNKVTQEPLVVTIAKGGGKNLQAILPFCPFLIPLLLEFADQAGWNAYHYLADVYVEEFEDLLCLIGDDSAARVLAAASSRGSLPVAHLFAARHPSRFASTVLRLPVSRAALISSADGEGWLPYHVLAKANSACLLELICGLELAEAIAVLAASNPVSGQPVAVLMAQAGPCSFRSLLQRYPGMATEALGMLDADGWSAYHHLADHHGAVLEQILLGLGDEGAARVLAAASPQGRKPVAHSLAERHPRGLARLVQRGGLVRAALLRAADAGGRLAYHVLAERHGGVLLDLLGALGREEAAQVLQARAEAAAGRTVAETLGAALRRRDPWPAAGAPPGGEGGRDDRGDAEASSAARCWCVQVEEAGAAAAAAAVGHLAAAREDEGGRNPPPHRPSSACGTGPVHPAAAVHRSAMVAAREAERPAEAQGGAAAGWAVAAADAAAPPPAAGVGKGWRFSGALWAMVRVLLPAAAVASSAALLLRRTGVW